MTQSSSGNNILKTASNATKVAGRGFVGSLKCAWKYGGNMWALATISTGIIWNPVMPQFTVLNWFIENGVGVEVSHLVCYAILVAAMFGFYIVAKQAWKSTSNISKIAWIVALSIFSGLLFQTGAITVVGTYMYTTLWLTLTFIIGISSVGARNVFKLFGARSVNVQGDSDELDGNID